MQLINFEVELEKTTTRASYFHLPAKARFKTLWNSTWSWREDDVHTFSLYHHTTFLPKKLRMHCCLLRLPIDAFAICMLLLSTLLLLLQSAFSVGTPCWRKGADFLVRKMQKRFAFEHVRAFGYQGSKGFFANIRSLLHYLFVVILIH